MTGDETGKEPGGWELMRAIKGVSESVDRLATRNDLAISKMVSADVYAIQMAALGERLSKAESAASTNASDLETYKAQVEDQKGKMRLMLYGLIGGPIATLLVVFVANGGLTSPGIGG